MPLLLRHGFRCGGVGAAAVTTADQSRSLRSDDLSLDICRFGNDIASGHRSRPSLCNRNFIPFHSVFIGRHDESRAALRDEIHENDLIFPQLRPSRADAGRPARRIPRPLGASGLSRGKPLVRDS